MRSHSIRTMVLVTLSVVTSFAQFGNDACRVLARLEIPGLEITEAAHVLESAALPAHCIVQGQIDKRKGVNGQNFAIGFELRLPDRWTGRFLFQGGGGMDGLVRPAIGQLSGGSAALGRGYAVVSTDAGHKGKDPNPSADPSFAVDQQARIDNAYRSIERVTGVAQRIVKVRYGRASEKSYFAGCSNGGRQGLMAVQRFPLLFDGVISGAPAFRVTKAAIGSAWETIAFTGIAPKDASGKPILSRVFSKEDLDLVAKGILEKCDALDGVRDGLVFNTSACHFDPAELVCRGDAIRGCLRADQAGVLSKVFSGPVNSNGRAIYSDWPYDPGVGSNEWRALKLGTSLSETPNSIDYLLMFPGLTGYFFFPPDKEFDPLRFDFDRDAERVDDTAALQDPTSTQVSTFVQHGGKLLLYHGMADPFFSANDTVRYYKSLSEHNGGVGHAEEWARLFLVPGMTHCGGGPSLDSFDVLSAMANWVEKGIPPQEMIASGKAFPRLTRPLCAYPKYATYKGTGDSSKAESFACR